VVNSPLFLSDLAIALRVDRYVIKGGCAFGFWLEDHAAPHTVALSVSILSRLSDGISVTRKLLRGIAACTKLTRLHLGGGGVFRLVNQLAPLTALRSLDLEFHVQPSIKGKVCNWPQVEDLRLRDGVSEVPLPTSLTRLEFKCPCPDGIRHHVDTWVPEDLPSQVRHMAGAVPQLQDRILLTDLVYAADAYRQPTCSQLPTQHMIAT
jgi:hypothetical protein